MIPHMSKKHKVKTLKTRDRDSMTGGDPLKVKKLLTLNTIGDTGRSIGVQGKEVEVKMGRHIKGKKAPHVPKQIAPVK